MKIVIVDDDKSMRSLLRALCVSEEHDVIAEFGDGVGLLEYVTEHHPDVVCLDFNLPGSNGLELLVAMDVAANQIDVIMISGSDEPELEEHAADLGATGFIRKPFEQSQIIAELNAIEEARRIVVQAAETPVPDVPVALTTEEPAAAACEQPHLVIPRTAVVVDDSASIRFLLKGILEAAGVKVTGMATNGRDGAEIVKKTRPALVCLDVDMPGMTGIEALPLVRAASPATNVVMITGNASRNIVEAAVSGGARGYFLKPIRPAKVEEFIRKLLQR